MAELLPKCQVQCREMWNQPHGSHYYPGRLALAILKPGSREDREILAETQKYLLVSNGRATRESPQMTAMTKLSRLSGAWKT